MNHRNRTQGLRAALNDSSRPALLGFFIVIPRVEILEMAGAAGFDLVVLDFEHGPFGIEVIPTLAAAAKGAGLHVVVRVADQRLQSIGAVLDAGVDGVLVPHVATGATATSIARATRYPPQGSRSLHPWVRGAGYGLAEDAMRQANEDIAIFGMAEDLEAVQNLPGILAEPELDGLFVGLVDLSAAMGIQAGPDAPEVREQGCKLVKATHQAGKLSALHASTPEAAAFWFAQGARLVTVACDADLIGRSFCQLVTGVKSAVKPHSA
jgi:4-hydroxy-2-oxoheptanedioate aldolase